MEALSQKQEDLKQEKLGDPFGKTQGSLDVEGSRAGPLGFPSISFGLCSTVSSARQVNR